MKRVLDIAISVCGILLILPFAFLIALWIKLDSKGPVFYRQKRVGRFGKDFLLYKFRSMFSQSDKGNLLTIGAADQRITKCGYYLRKYKLDEIPQLLNVLIGNMSLVGPRPEVRKYVQLYTEEQKKVLNVKPGITDLASIAYKNENDLLAQSKNPEQTYIQYILPDKLKLNMIYIDDPSLKNYIWITMKTIVHILFK